jgi:hypothetical protein
MHRARSADNAGASTVKYCIHGSYLFAIQVSKSQCLKNMVSGLRLEVKEISGAPKIFKLTNDYVLRPVITSALPL